MSFHFHGPIPEARQKSWQGQYVWSQAISTAHTLHKPALMAGWGMEARQTALNQL